MENYMFLHFYHFLGLKSPSDLPLASLTFEFKNIQNKGFLVELMHWQSAVDSESYVIYIQDDR